MLLDNEMTPKEFEARLPDLGRLVQERAEMRFISLPDDLTLGAATHSTAAMLRSSVSSSLHPGHSDMWPSILSVSVTVPRRSY